MIITCEACSKRYHLDEASFGQKTRLVRCASCGHSWHQAPLSREAAAPVGDLGAMADMARFGEEDKADAKRSFIPWVAFLLAVAVLSAVGFAMRGRIAAHWPAFAHMMDKAGLMPAAGAPGLMIENVVPSQITENGRTSLIVRAELVNTSSEVRQVPELTLMVRGDCEAAGLISRLTTKKDSPHGASCVLDKWTHKLSETRLQAGERVRFETTPRPALEAAKDIVIEF
ncbi:MAG: zinc-ribbon domain-containing protein [Holosporales bacterium]